eukprot:7214442-Alexandrium_andersonii.AAC.1
MIPAHASEGAAMLIAGALANVPNELRGLIRSPTDTGQVGGPGFGMDAQWQDLLSGHGVKGGHEAQ